MLVTVARYRAITGDTTSVGSAVEEAIAYATEQLEDVLDRPLEDTATRTESVNPMRDGFLWPRAVPVQSVEGEYEVDGYGIRGSLPWPGSPFVGMYDPVTIEYRGGFQERTAAPDGATNKLPTYMERGIL